MNALCAVTGSNGYVGSCIKRHLATRGWDILELVRQPTPGAKAVPFRLGEEIAPSALTGVKALVHCAYDFRPCRWDDIQSVNVGGTEKLLKAAKAAGVEKIVCISSISAYPGCRSLYGRAKLAVEQLALANGALVIRPGLVYGHGPGGMFGKLTAQVRKSAVIPLIGDGSQIQFLVHEEDLGTFIAKYLEGITPPLPSILTAAHPEPWPFKKLLQAIAEAAGKKVTFIPLPWRLVWLGLRTAEALGLRLNFRSDSLISLMYPVSAPDFAPNGAAGLNCRRFQIEKRSKLE
jgi:nucleoside-diphosphate-sugar epimerase